MEYPNIMLIVCDTLRQDVLQVYGGPAKTPNLNKLAKDAMVYDNCIAPSPWTFPSHVSLFTGLYQSQHGIHETRKLKTADLIPLNRNLRLESLPGYLKGMGYSTMGISNNIMVSRFTHFDSDFGFFLNVEASPWSQSEEIKAVKKMGASATGIAKKLVSEGRFAELFKYGMTYMRIKQVANAMNYPLDKGIDLTNKILLDSKLESSFFLFLNFLEVHETYEGGEVKEILDDYTGIRPIRSKRVEDLKDQYVEEVEYLDKKLGELLVMLKNRNLYDNTIIILTSDHGQAFNEHGYMYHGRYLYDEITRIPLIIKYPSSKKFQRKTGYQSLANLFRLIKDILDGKDDNALNQKYVFSEAYGDVSWLPEFYKHRSNYVSDKYEKVRKAIYSGNFKLTVNGSDGTIEEFLIKGKPSSIQKHKKTIRQLINLLKQQNLEENLKYPRI